MTPARSLTVINVLLLIVLSSCGVSLSGAAPETPDPTVSVNPQESVIPLPSASPTFSTVVPDSTAFPAGGEKGDCDSRPGTMQGYRIPWEDDILTGRIYTPPCYGEDPDQRYPVLYLLHGTDETDQQWDDLGVDEMADQLIKEGEISPLLIVMPREITSLSLAENPFEDQLVQVVIPWVDSQFQTTTDRQYRAVGGLSRGGNWAVRLGLLHWDLFGALGGHSTPLFYGDLFRLPDWLEDIPQDKQPLIYLDIGEEDKNLSEARAFRDLLIKNGLEPEWHLNPGLHDQAYWTSHLEEYLRWYSAFWNTN